MIAEYKPRAVLKLRRDRVPCPVCGTAFLKNNRSPSLNEESFCSVKCKSAVMWPVVKCLHCGDGFRQRRAGSGRTQYCSHNCYVDSKRIELLPCLWCGQECGRRHRRWCSNACHEHWKRRERGISEGIPKCVVCGQDARKNKQGSYTKTCSDECRDERMRAAHEQGRVRLNGLTPTWREQYAIEIATHGEAWVDCMRLAISKYKSRTKSREEMKDPWRRKFSAILKGQSNRIPSLGKRKPRRIRTTWREVIDRSVGLHNRRKYRLDPWTRKFDTTARNWRRKAAWKEMCDG